MSQYYHGRSEGDEPTYIIWPRRQNSLASDARSRTGTAVILAAEGSGYQAVRMHLDNLHEEVYQGSVYERGMFSTGTQTWEVGLVEISEGGANVSFETERALSYFKPDALLYISLVTGMQEVQLGDVVSPTKVYGYESGRSAATFETKPDAWTVSYEMAQRARADARRTDWVQRVKDPSDTSLPNVVLKPIASGEKVLASTRSKLYPFLLSHYNDAVAVEMGGYGVLVAAHAHSTIKTLVVCGISELVQNGREESTIEWRRVAAHRASAFAFEVLANLVPPAAAQESVTKEVQEPAAMANPKPANGTDTCVEIFYSYVTEDKQLAQQLQKQLAPLEKRGLIANWDRYKVAGGADLEERQRHLDTAAIVVVFVSPEYIVSQYYEDEAKWAIKRRASGKPIVVPVHLRPTNGWEYTEFSNLQAIPREGKAVTEFSRRNQAWSEVAREIGAIVESLQKTK